MDENWNRVIKNGMLAGATFFLLTLGLIGTAETCDWHGKPQEAFIFTRGIKLSPGNSETLHGGEIGRCVISASKKNSRVADIKPGPLHPIVLAYMGDDGSRVFDLHIDNGVEKPLDAQLTVFPPFGAVRDADGLCGGQAQFAFIENTLDSPTKKEPVK